MRSLLYALTVLSLPMRGAWIGITFGASSGGSYESRSPCGERGLELSRSCVLDRMLMSLPMRGAWIGISFVMASGSSPEVAPHAGSVDWNKPAPRAALESHSRSPCGERGLEFLTNQVSASETRRSPCGERGLE